MFSKSTNTATSESVGLNDATGAAPLYCSTTRSPHVSPQPKRDSLMTPCTRISHCTFEHTPYTPLASDSRQFAERFIICAPVKTLLSSYRAGALRFPPILTLPQEFRVNELLSRFFNRQHDQIAEAYRQCIPSTPRSQPLRVLDLSCGTIYITPAPINAAPITPALSPSAARTISTSFPGVGSASRRA